MCISKGLLQKLMQEFEYGGLRVAADPPTEDTRRMDCTRANHDSDMGSQKRYAGYDKIMGNFFYLAGIQEKAASRYQRPFSICMLDADNLKQTNDRHGHFAGTELIKHIGKIINRRVRATDIPARYGGG